MFKYARFFPPPTLIPPGLRFIPNFLSNESREALINSSLELRKEISSFASKKEARIYLSRQHNLSSEEYYRKLRLRDNVGYLDAQHFERYGEEGHELTYFIGTKNIPDFIRRSLISDMEQLDEIKSLRKDYSRGMLLSQVSNCEEEKSLDWNCTFNFYTQRKDNKQAGFPFHIDIESNGEITGIITFRSAATIEMRKKGAKESSYSCVLTPGSLLLLTKEARWDWEHRVLSQDSEMEDTSRISAVLGCNTRYSNSP